MTTRVYKFGLLPPTVESERARELMFAGHRLKNQLTEIENNYRYAFRLLTADLPEVIRVAEVDAKWKNLKERILQARQDTNSRKAPPELLAERTVLKAESETARAAAKVARKIRSEDPLHAQALADLDERVKILRKLAYEASGVTWGVRALLTDSVRQAAATTPIYANIDFQSFNGTTKRIGVTAPSADGPSFHQLLEAPSSPGGRRKRAILRLRVTDDRRSPTFAEFPMTLHRPIPPGKIVQVTVSMKTEANWERWSAEFVVKEEITAPAHGIGTVAVNVGWRSKTDGVRVLTCVDHEREWTIQISPKIVHQLNKARDLRSIRDNRKKCNDFTCLASSDFVRY